MMNVEMMERLYKMFVENLNIFIVSCIILLMLLSWYYFIFFFSAIRRPKKFSKGKTQYKYAVLVPARNEDNVIKNCLTALSKQDYPKTKFDVYVIVESKDDPTIKITKEMGSNFHVIIRKNLNHRRTKGYALDDAFQHLEKSKIKYDALMIFDADNVMNPDYISKMNDCKNQGYKIATGYRNFTNATTNWVSSSSAILFSFMNQFTSKGRSTYFDKCTLTGTGYYIDYDIVKNEGGWIWDGMTEDVELTCYCYAHNIKMHYYPIAMYYDEQSPKYSVIHKQHVRWVWGFFSSKKKFKRNTFDYGNLKGIRRWLANLEYNFSIYPFICFCIMEVLACLLGLCLFVSSIITACLEGGEQLWADSMPQTVFCWFLLSFSYLYLTYVFVATLVLCLDNRNLKFSVPKAIISILSYFFFFGDFFFAFFDGLFHKQKRSSWDKIIHEGDVIDERAKEAINGKKVKSKK